MFVIYTTSGRAIDMMAKLRKGESSLKISSAICLLCNSFA